MIVRFFCSSCQHYLQVHESFGEGESYMQQACTVRDTVDKATNILLDVLESPFVEVLRIYAPTHGAD